MTKLVWALWIVTGGYVNSGHLSNPEIKGYFETAPECMRVAKLVDNLSVWNNGQEHHIRYQCIQANYFIPKAENEVN